MTDIEQMEGTLTAFNGFQFGGGGFNYLEGRRILGLAMDALRRRTDLRSELGIAPQHPGRKTIKEDDDVWDVLVFASFAEAQDFTENPHLALGIGGIDVSAMVTLPDNARRHWRALIGLDKEDFCCKVDTVLENMRPLLSNCPGAEPRLRVRQRHWNSRSAPPLRDAYIDIDLRTRSGESRVKPQPEWIGAAFDVLKNKRKESNLELQVGARFPYRTCQAIQQPEALDFAAAAWIACKPYIEAICESRGAGNQG